MDEFRLLGPLEVVVDGSPLRIAAQKPRALLALLLLNANRVVPTERLIDELWGEEPPTRATKTLQVYVSQLRKELGAERLVTRAPGYELRVGEGELDVDRFESLAAEARAESDPGKAAAALREALALWRGPALREFREPFANAAAARLEELRLAAVENRIQAELETGATTEVIPELEELVAGEPLRERPRELLMLALYRAGRQADALDLYRRTRELFVDELGIEPGSGLRELEQAVLRQDSDLRAPPRRARTASDTPPSAPRRPWLLAAAALLVLVVAAVAVTAFTGGDGGEPALERESELRPFVFKLENFLAQSHDGRDQVRQAVSDALECRLSAARAEARLDSVQRNRQSILQQLAALSVPAGDQPLRSSDLLQKAIAASIAADGVYRDWLRERRSCRSGEPPPPAARRADANATRLKREFLVAFDPLAKRFHQRVWRADEF